MDITKNEALKYVRKSAKKVGLVFKQSNTRLNEAYLYKLCDRKTGETIMRNYQFWSAYADSVSGYIESWNGTKFDYES